MLRCDSRSGLSGWVPASARQARQIANWRSSSLVSERSQTCLKYSRSWA